MKTFKKFTASLVSTLIALSTIGAISTTAFAETEQQYLKSVFTPNRPCVNFTEGIDGLTYPSFNNFCNNPNLINYEGKSAHATYQDGTVTQLTKGDERVFTTGVNWTKCEGNECSYYGNSVGEVDALNYGEVISFSIYFHNNGSDPYDNTNPNTSTNAKNVKIGIDVSNIHILDPSDPYPNLVRPRGYIEANNNSYPNATPAVNMGAKATDDLPIFYNTAYDKDDVEMEIIPGSAYLTMNEEDPSTKEHKSKYGEGVDDFSKEITKMETITFKTDKGDKNVVVKPEISQDKKKIWLNFSELPGCFRYSGFAYFQARLVPPPPEQPNFCKSLDLESTPITIYAATKDDKIQTPLCTPEQKTTKFEINVNFNKEGPQEGYVTIHTTDLKGTIYLDDSSQSEAITKFPATVKLSNGKVTGTYTGLGELAAVFTDENGDPGVYIDNNGNILETDEIKAYSKLAPSICQDLIPTCENDCKDLCVERPKEMTEGTYFPLSAEAIGFYDENWGDIKYTTEYVYAELYKGTEEEVVAKIKEKHGVDPVKNTSFILGCDPLYINLFSAGDLMTGVINTIMNYDSIAEPDDKLLPAYDETKKDSEDSEKEDETLFLPNFQFYINPNIIKTISEIDLQSLYEIPENPELKIKPDGGDPVPIEMPATNIKVFNPQHLQNNVLLALTPIFNIDTSSLMLDQSIIKESAIQLETIPHTVLDQLPNNSMLEDNAKDVFDAGDLQSAYQTVIAGPGETVWVYAKKAGDDKIKVTTTKSTDNENCTNKFDILKAPEAPSLVCESIDVSALSMKDGSKVTCIDENQAVAFKISDIELEDKNGNTMDEKNHQVFFKWTAAENGTFSYLPTDVLKQAQSPFYTQLKNVMYLGKGPVTTEVTSIDGEDLVNTPCKFTLPACKEVKIACKDLSLTFDDGTKSALVGETKEMQISVKSDQNEDYPSTIKWIDHTQGKILFPKFTQVEQEQSTLVVDDVEKELTIYTTPYPLTGDPILTDTQTAGLVTASVIGEEGICFDSVSVDEESKCLLLSYTIYNSDNSLATFRTKNPTLLGTKQYKLSSNVKYSKDKAIKTVTYESHEGYFALEKPFKEMLPAYDETKWPLADSKVVAPAAPETDNSRVVAPKGADTFIDSQVIAPAAPTPTENSRVVAPVAPTPAENSRVVAPVAPTRTKSDALVDSRVVAPVAPETPSRVVAPAAPGDTGSRTVAPTTPEDSFIDSSVIAPAAPLVNRLLKIFNRITIPDPDLTKWSSKLENVPVNQKVLFTPKSDLEPGKTYNKSIKIQATNSDPLEEPECTQYIALVIPVDEDVCQNITVKAAPWPFQPSAEKTKIFIDESASDFGDYTGNFTFSLTKFDKVRLFIDENLQNIPKYEIEVTQEQAKNGIYLGATDKEWALAVKATDENPTACLQTITYIPEVTPPPEEETFCENLKIVEPETWIFDENEDEQEFEIQVTPENYPFIMEWEIHQDSGSEAHLDHGSSTSLKNTLNNISTAVQSITVKVKEDQTDENSDCEATISMGTPSGTVTPPSIKKRVRTEDLNNNNNDWDDLLNISEDEDYLTYRVVYKPGTDSDEVENSWLKDTGFKNQIIEGSEDGEFEYTGDFEIEIDRKSGWDLDEDDLYDCDDEDHKDHIEDYGICIEHDDTEDLMDEYTDGDWAKFKILDADNIYKITIYYEVENNTNISEQYCDDLTSEDGCGEEFPNEVEFEAGKYDGDDDTLVVVVCPYILTSTSGDVFFNSALDTGTDVSYCSPQKNVQGPIIKPLIEIHEIVATGTGDPADTLLKLPQHDVCKFSNTGENLEGYNNPFTHFSSTICEVEAEVAEDWMTENVVSQINANIEKLSKWSGTIYGPLTSMSSLISAPNASQGVFRAESNLVINGAGGTYTIEKNSSVPAAQTYIVKGADLHIKSDIVYGSTDYSKQSEIPAAAFVVIDGDIIIDPDVEKLYGTYIAIDTKDSGKGKILSNGVSHTQLTFYGSLIGDVTDLFSNRKYVGDISSEGGSVTVKQTADFLLNTPPGLNELMDVTQLEVAY